MGKTFDNKHFTIDNKNYNKSLKIKSNKNNKIVIIAIVTISSFSRGLLIIRPFKSVQDQ